MNELLKKIGEPAALENLAEECSELAHAALKLARVLRNENPTPVKEEEARSNVEKELADVLASAYISDVKFDTDFVDAKLDRAEERITYKIADVFIGKRPKKHLVLCGPTCSGKTTLARYLRIHQNFNIRNVVTTRHPRNGDYEDEYTFVDDSTFLEMVHRNCFDFRATYRTLDGPIDYGYNWHIFESNNYSVSVMSYEELLYMGKDRPGLFKNLFVVYLETPEHICQRRAIARGDNSFEVGRRVLSERAPLSELQHRGVFDLVYSNYSEPTENIAKDILFKMHL